MSSVKLFNGYVTKASKSKAFQTDNMYVPTGTRMFTNHLESARTNYSTTSNMSSAWHERNALVIVDVKQVKRHLKYLSVNTSKNDEDEIYTVMVSEITDS